MWVRNKKKILLIVIPIVVVLIIVAVVAVLYFTTDLFKSNKELFWKYLAQNEDITNILKNDKFVLDVSVPDGNNLKDIELVSNDDGLTFSN